MYILPNFSAIYISCLQISTVVKRENWGYGIGSGSAKTHGANKDPSDHT